MYGIPRQAGSSKLYSAITAFDHRPVILRVELATSEVDHRPYQVISKAIPLVE